MKPRFLSIRTQVGFLLVLSLGLSFTGALFSIYRTLESRFLSLEARETRTNIERVAEVVAHELNNLGFRIKDWADWDDAAEYMAEKNKKFEDANLVLDVLDSMHLDSIRFYHMDRTLQGGVDRSEGEFAYLPALLDQRLAREEQLWKLGNTLEEELIAGILQLDDHYFIIATRGVRDTSGEGAPVGRLFFIQKLDESFAEKISQLVKHDVRMRFLSDQGPRDIRGEVLEHPTLPIMARSSFEIVSETSIQSTLVAKDSRGMELVAFDFSLNRQLMQQGRETIKAVALAFSVTIGVALLALGWGLNTLVVKRLLKLTHEVTAVGKDRDAKVLVSTEGHNEVTLLAEQINTMLQTIRFQTKAIHDIVNNVRAGFLTTDVHGVIGKGYTAYCHDLFGQENISGHKLSQLLFRTEKDREHFDSLYEQVIENFIPADLTLPQLPHLIEHQGRWLRMEGAGLYDGEGALTGVLFTLTDVSQQIEVERRNRENSALLKIVRSLNNFASFKEGTRRALEYWEQAKVIDEHQGEARRFLHTLKGNLGVYGLSEIAQLIHKIEGESRIRLEHMTAIRKAIETFVEKSFDLTGLHYEVDWAPQVTVPRSLLVEMKSKAVRWKNLEQSTHEVVLFVEKALRTPFRDCIKGLVEEGNLLAKRLHKNINFAVEGADILIDQETLRVVLDNLVHALRNAVDHGIEAPAERTAKGKISEGVITLRASQNGRSFAIEVEDDGRGVDRKKLEALAIQRGLWSSSRGDLTDQAVADLIFADGISTAQTVTDISGRGVGLAALKAEVEKLGGSISFSSELGKGSKLHISWREAETTATLVA